MGARVDDKELMLDQMVRDYYDDQMVRDYYESESSTAPSNFPSPSRSSHLSNLQNILLEATDYENQIQEKVLMYIRNMGEPNSLKKGVVLRLQMDGYKASLCKTSWVDRASLWKTSWVDKASLCKTSWVDLSSLTQSKVFQYEGEYEFIEVMIMEEEKQTRVIVDMDFRTQFELARPTQTYEELINFVLPSVVFVGTEDRVKRTVSSLCSAAEDSFKEKDLHFPPWRKYNYMKLKWFSKNCHLLV